MLPVIFDEYSTDCSAANTLTNRNISVKRALWTMIFSFFRRIDLFKLYQVIFFVPFLFLFTCSKHCYRPSDFISCLTSDEKMDLQQFFHSLLFHNYGAYVLLGSKPLCELSVREMNSPAADEAFKQFLEGLSEEEREKIKSARLKAQAKQDLDKEMDLESSRYRGFLVLQKLMDRFKLNGFLLRVVPMLRPDAYDILFINIQKTAIILAENYEIFQQAAGMDFHPLQIVFEAENPNSLFWKKVMSLENHLAKGLLFGFGLKNSIFGHLKFSQEKGNLNIYHEKYRKEIEPFLRQSSLSVSTDIVPKGNASFHIPLFVSVPGDKTADKYGKEKAIIERKYLNKDIIEVTLNQLFQFSEK